MAQENLAGGVVGTLAVASVLLFSGTASWRAVRAALVTVLGRFVVDLGAGPGVLRHPRRFWGVPIGVPATPSGRGRGEQRTRGRAPLAASSLTDMYYILPFMLAILALLPVFQFRPLRIATEWSRERVSFVVTVVATILLYQGVMLRADTSHLTGTLLVVPAVVVVAAIELPSCSAAARATDGPRRGSGHRVVRAAARPSVRLEQRAFLGQGALP